MQNCLKHLALFVHLERKFARNTFALNLRQTEPSSLEADRLVGSAEWATGLPTRPNNRRSSSSRAAAAFRSNSSSDVPCRRAELCDDECLYLPKTDIVKLSILILRVHPKTR